MQKPSDCDLPQDTAQKKGEECGQPQIAPADPEHIVKPNPDCPRQEQQIPQNGMPGTQRTQKSVPHTENSPQCKSHGKPLRGDDRFCHPNRCRQPPDRGSS